MLTFLRKIRKSLLESGNAIKPASPERPNGLMSGRAGRCLLYAMGEIALVMIGILLALQVNNWNSSRQLKSQEKAILLEIRRNIEANIKEIDADIENYSRYIHSLDVALKHINDGIPYQDSLSDHLKSLFAGRNFNVFVGRYFNGTSAGYDVLKNSVDITLQDQLRVELSDYFEETIEDLDRTMEDLVKINDQYLGKVRLDYVDLPTPDKYRRMYENRLTRSAFSLTNQRRKIVLRRMQRFKDTTVDMVPKLNKYLEEKFSG